MLLRRFWIFLLGLGGAALLATVPVLAAPSGPRPAPVSATAAGSSTAAPTVDRLAAPPTVVNPSQADLGAQLFWQHCQPCHGDQAQGLTDEWRAQYPPEDQNCWNRGCHSDHPYQNGFTLPHTVPALVGPGTLSRFPTAADLYTFVSHAMPFQAPGSLKPSEYWAISAFLLSGHGLPAADLPITDVTIAQHIPLGNPIAATPAPSVRHGAAGGLSAAVAVIGAAGLALAGAGWLVWRRARGHG